jgi:hypothetical protein
VTWETDQYLRLRVWAAGAEEATCRIVRRPAFRFGMATLDDRENDTHNLNGPNTRHSDFVNQPQSFVTKPDPVHSAPKLGTGSAENPSWMMATGNGNAFAARMLDAINGMLLDMLGAIARKGYEDRRRRQAQGQAKAKAEGRCKGRPADVERNEGIARRLTAKMSWNAIQSATAMQPRHHREDS